MSTNVSFPLSDFYDALNSKNVKQKLQPFIAQFRKKNIYIIYQCVNRLIQIIQNKSQQPLMKFNALMTVRYFFDTCQYAAITFIEIYMLPVIYEIALEKYLKRSQQGMELYFVDRGAQNTKQMRRLGLNYVQLAAEFIFNSAKVKPYRLIQNRQLKQESNFKRTVKVLNNKGINEQQKCIYYIPSYPTQTRKKFLKKLKHISAQPYISFVISNFLQEINLNKKCDLDIKKLILHGDSFLTSTMVEIIQEQLSKMSQNFINKKKYLNLLNDLIRSGEIQSIYLVNTSDFIRQIGQEIKKVKGNLGFAQGEYIYPKIQASKQQKKQFYIDFLRMLEIWANCMPSTDDGQQSDVLKVYQQLKQLNFVFPKNVMLKKIKDEMDENLLLNQQRNQTLMRIIDEDERVSQRNNGSYVSSKGEFKFHFPQYKQKQSYIQLDELHYKVYQTKKRIARLTLDKQQLTQNMNFIKQFVNNWDEELQKLDIQDEDPHQLQMLVDEGDLCGQQYKLIKPIYELYMNKRITFEQFAQKIEFLQHPQENSVNKSSSMRNSLYNRQQESQISLEQRLINTKHSKPQSIRKNIKNQYVTQYGYNNIKVETEENKSLKKYDQKRSYKQSSRINTKNNQQNSEQQSQQKFSSQSSSNIQSKVSSQNQLSVNKSSQYKSSRLSQSKKSQSIKRPIDLGYSKKSNGNNKVIEYQHQDNYGYESKSKHSNVMSSKKSYKKQQQSQKQQTSRVSSFQKQSISSEEKQKSQSFKSPPKKVVIFKTERQRSPLTSNNQMSSLNGLKTQSNQKQLQSQKSIQQKYTPTKKSVIKHSVISKSSYHSQPHEAQMVDSGYNEGNSVMNDYEIENVPVQVVNQNGINLKKSSIKRTQSSAMRNSSHKRIQQSQHNLSKSQKKSSHQITDAVSPFKKKKQSQSKDIKIKESFIKDYEFVHKKNESQQKRTNIKIDDNFTYEDAFRRRDEYQRGQNDSQISSQSQSVLEKRNNKLKKKQVIKQIAKINLNEHSEYYVEDTSILRKSKNQMKSATKNLILFDSNHSNNQSPLKQSKSANKYHEEYEIVEQKDNKIKKLTDKISQMSKNTSKFAYSKGRSSGIKLISRNDNKSFDKLYKNQYGNDMFGQHNAMGNRDMSVKKRYDEINSQYRNQNLANSSKSPFKTENHKLNNIDEKMKQSQHGSNQNVNSNNNNNLQSEAMTSSQHTSMQYQHLAIDYQFENFKANMIKKRVQNDDISQINQPENQPMLYSYCSDKSIHSKLTDSHTRRGNNRSSNNQQFKTCFMNMDKEVLPLTGAKTKIVSNSFSSLDKAFNFIDCKGSNAKSSSKVHSVADAISEKNAKNSILLYKLQRQKTRLVQNLQHKIKQLEVNGKMMKTKYALKDQSIRQNLSSRQLSQPQLKLNTKIIKTSRQSTEQNNSLFVNEVNSNKNMNLNINTRSNNNNNEKQKQKYHNEQITKSLTNLFVNKNYQIKTINTKEYNKFFQQYRQHSIKKTLHKKKGLFIKNDEIEIGYMINKKDKYLVMNMFITPYAGSIKNLKAEVIVDNNIAVKHKLTKIDLIQLKKQQVISTSFYIQNLPYKLPIIKISFDPNRSYLTNNYTLGLPATIMHFSDMLEKTQKIDKNGQQSGKNEQIAFLRTQIFRCSKKLNKVQKLFQAFPQMKQVKKDKKLTILESIIIYQSIKVQILIALNTDSGQSVIYGHHHQQQQQLLNQKSITYLQYLLATMQLVMEEQ